jgi:hypothetical protein
MTFGKMGGLRHVIPKIKVLRIKDIVIGSICDAGRCRNRLSG